MVIEGIPIRLKIKAGSAGSVYWRFGESVNQKLGKFSLKRRSPCPPRQQLACQNIKFLLYPLFVSHYFAFPDPNIST